MSFNPKIDPSVLKSAMSENRWKPAQPSIREYFWNPRKNIFNPICVSASGLVEALAYWKKREVTWKQFDLNEVKGYAELKDNRYIPQLNMNLFLSKDNNIKMDKVIEAEMRIKEKVCEHILDDPRLNSYVIEEIKVELNGVVEVSFKGISKVKSMLVSELIKDGSEDLKEMTENLQSILQDNMNAWIDVNREGIEESKIKNGGFGFSDTTRETYVAVGGGVIGGAGLLALGISPFGLLGGTALAVGTVMSAKLGSLAGSGVKVYPSSKETFAGLKEKKIEDQIGDLKTYGVLDTKYESKNQDLNTYVKAYKKLNVDLATATSEDLEKYEKYKKDFCLNLNFNGASDVRKLLGDELKNKGDQRPLVRVLNEYKTMSALHDFFKTKGVMDGSLKFTNGDLQDLFETYNKGEGVELAEERISKAGRRLFDCYAKSWRSFGPRRWIERQFGYSDPSIIGRKKDIEEVLLNVAGLKKTDVVKKGLHLEDFVSVGTGGAVIQETKTGWLGTTYTPKIGQSLNFMAYKLHYMKMHNAGKVSKNKTAELTECIEKIHDKLKVAYKPNVMSTLTSADEQAILQALAYAVPSGNKEIYKAYVKDYCKTMGKLEEEMQDEQIDAYFLRAERFRKYLAENVTSAKTYWFWKGSTLPSSKDVL